MAKGKRSYFTQPASVKSVEVSKNDDPESTKVNLADGAALKRALDEAASKVCKFEDMRASDQQLLDRSCIAD